MPRFEKGYQTLIGRSLLLAGYLFLFAGQFNYKYFTIANFYVYGHRTTVTAGVRGGAAIRSISRVSTRARYYVNVRAAGGHTVALQDNTQRPSHLGIDKRYRGQHGVRVPQIRAPGVTSYVVIKTRVHTVTPDCYSTDLPTASLRGPPCA